jgi:hypothetical protein
MKNTAPIFRDMCAVFHDYLGQLPSRQSVSPFRSIQLLLSTVINSFTEQNIASLCHQLYCIYLSIFVLLFSLPTFAFTVFVFREKRKR